MGRVPAALDAHQTELGTENELAALMGVGQGMVAKSEVLPAKPLGEGMAAAFMKVALPGSATR